MVKDIILDTSGDLLTSNGDFVVADSDPQHLMLIVNLTEGSIKQYPLQGAGIMNYSGSTGKTAELQRAIKVKAGADNYQNVQVLLKQLQDGTFEYTVDAERT